MNRLRQIPLRYLLLIVIGGLTVMIGSLSYYSIVPGTLRNVERQATGRMTATLSEAQGVLEFLIREDKIAGAKRVVASYGAAPGHEAMLLSDGDGVVIASTSIAEIGRDLDETPHHIQTGALKGILESGGIGVELQAARQVVVGYTSICGASSAGGLRPSHCGFLYYRKSYEEDGLSRSLKLRKNLPAAINPHGRAYGARASWRRSARPWTTCWIMWWRIRRNCVCATASSRTAQTV